ncbi:uncharacterized protein LOC127750442 [Frankliniella occidentalis]|uniref:Uncharacterized protein LOC127750442 n=1 Tax=Frankliniella occidentalis TaxID=133901 RepID=A0A9C6X2T2_FRAOC|nr:uncharacterized protein LOC127750442 [Frankliniella occidentalis]
MCPLSMVPFLCLVVGLIAKVAMARSFLAPIPLVAEILNLKECQGVPDNAMTFFGPNSSSMRGRGNYTFNASFNITRTVKRISEIRVEMTRCRDVVSSNTCEHFGNWRFQSDPCKVWMDPVAPWGGLVKSIVEDYTCPTRVGTYHMRDAVLDMKVLQALHLPLEGAVWQNKAFFLESSGSTHYCFKGTTVFRRVRA